MSQIENIAGELRVMAAGIDRAQANAAGADNTAQEIASRAARSGFTGIAAGMSQVRSSIAEIRARLAAVGGSLNEAVTAMAATSGEISPEQAVAALVPVQEKVGGVRNGVMAVVAKVEETKQLAAAVLRGGQPGPMISALEAVKEVLVLVAQRGGTAKQQVDTAIGEARQLGDQVGWPRHIAMPGPPQNRACDFHRTRLKQAPWALGWVGVLGCCRGRVAVVGSRRG